jgi:hypothetical protein
MTMTSWGEDVQRRTSKQIYDRLRREKKIQGLFAYYLHDSFIISDIHCLIAEGSPLT